MSQQSQQRVLKQIIAVRDKIRYSTFYHGDREWGRGLWTIHHKPREMECVWYYLLLRFTRATKQYTQHRWRMSRRGMVKVRYYLLCIWLLRSSRGRNLELAHKNRANPNPTVISMQIRECCGEFIFLCWFTICSPQHNTQSECNLCRQGEDMDGSGGEGGRVGDYYCL